MFCGLTSSTHQPFTAPCTKSSPHHPCFRFLCKQPPVNRGTTDGSSLPYRLPPALPGLPPVLFPHAFATGKG